MNSELDTKAERETQSAPLDPVAAMLERLGESIDTVRTSLGCAPGETIAAAAARVVGERDALHEALRTLTADVDAHVCAGAAVGT